jgi:hypothetical protein
VAGDPDPGRERTALLINARARVGLRAERIVTEGGA